MEAMNMSSESSMQNPAENVSNEIDFVEDYENETVPSDDGDLGVDPPDWATEPEALSQVAQETVHVQQDGGVGEAADESSEEPEISARDERYRQRLRESEAESTRLREIVESMQRAEVERLAADRLADSSDLFIKASLADMLDQDRVDPAKVNAAIDRLLADHPHWAAPVTRYRGPLRSGATSVRFDQPTKKFVDAFAPPKAE
jgi:hypothetical protein